MHDFGSFSTLESIMATRMSLLLSTKQREQRDQIGDLETPVLTELKQLERKCLLRLSKAARLSESHQTALNAIIHAQRLEKLPSFEVGEEFSQVLWLLKEHKSAVEYLRRFVIDIPAPATDAQGATKCALALSRLVRLLCLIF
jgi:ataxia telangiectasia mutated family protein